METIVMRSLLTGWAMQDLLAMRAGREVDGDMIGAGILAAVMALMPLAVPEASWISGGVGILAGIVIGFPLEGEKMFCGAIMRRRASSCASAESGTCTAI